MILSKNKNIPENDKCIICKKLYYNIRYTKQ